jgi:hypothetical protein
MQFHGRTFLEPEVGSKSEPSIPYSIALVILYGGATEPNFPGALVDLSAAFPMPGQGIENSIGTLPRLQEIATRW